ncbi:uncharacterized protein LOC112878540 [Panicum hallii]|uniref:uncharacterized protein LOC112878540 n=1 Tax=Panicum hallii TaxID=206008 RepID=UPI000DF4CD9A|nr:uncharacterized protein LOC112878540 [Panicum hallii]
MLEYDVPSNGTRRRSYDGEFLREMHKRQQAGRRGGKSKVTITTRRVGRRSCGAKAAVRRNELGGASMQPSTATLPANFFINHGISLSSSFSLHRSYSPREFTSVCSSPPPRYDYFCNGTYKFSQEFTKDMSEDQVNVTKEYRKPRTKVRKMLTFLTSDPPIKVKPLKILLFPSHD